jgi:hypothetical protein
MEGLADGAIPGQRSPLGETEKAYLREQLAEERAWTAGTLAEAVNKKFKLSVNRESLRVCLLELGYTWQRQRYVPIKTPAATVLKEAKATLDSFKKKQKRGKLHSSTSLKQALVYLYPLVTPGVLKTSLFVFLNIGAMLAESMSLARCLVLKQSSTSNTNYLKVEVKLSKLNSISKPSLSKLNSKVFRVSLSLIMQAFIKLNVSRSNGKGGRRWV